MTLFKRLSKEADRKAATLPVVIRKAAIAAAKKVARYEQLLPANPDRTRFVVWAALGCPIETPAVSKLIAEIINESK